MSSHPLGSDCMKVVEVRRVSTDDRGQDPARQGIINTRWAKEHKVEIIATVTDEGTSAWKVPPFKRPKFMEALNLAVEKGAEGIIIETVDRLTRQGPEVWGYVKIVVKMEYGLDIYCADAGAPGEQTGFVAQLISAAKGAAALHDSEQRSRRTKEGMARARARGVKLGAPPKVLTPEQTEEMMRLHGEGLGYRRIADRISKMRGADDVATLEAKKKRRVSYQHIYRMVKKQKIQQGLGKYTE